MHCAIDDQESATPGEFQATPSADPPCTFMNGSFSFFAIMNLNVTGWVISFELLWRIPTRSSRYESRRSSTHKQDLIAESKRMRRASQGSDSLCSDEILTEMLFIDITLAITRCSSLKRLSLERYDLYDQSRLLPPRSADLSMVTSLVMTDLSFLEAYIALEPPSIRSLRLHIPGHVAQTSDRISDLRSFIFQCHKLETLDMKGVLHIVDEPLLTAIGQHLLSLRLDEIITLPIIECSLPVGVIGRICPKLQQFGIDIGQSRRWVDWVKLWVLLYQFHWTD